MSARKESPLVSICLPVYNGARFLRRAIESALAQTYENFELLVSDDASSDDSLQVIQKYASQDKRIVVLTTANNAGLFENYNRCIAAARGTFVKLFAQDDVFDPRMIERMLPVFEQYPSVALVSCAKKWIDPGDVELKSFRTFETSRLVPGSEVILYNLLNFRNWVGEPSTVMYRAELAGSGFDTNFYHYGDMDYWFQILNGRDYYYLDENLCAFRRHPESGSTRNNKGLLFGLDLFRLIDKYQSVLSNFGETPEERIRRVLECIALNVDYQVKEEGLQASEAIAIGLGRVSKDVADMSDEEKDREVVALRRALGEFKQTSFYALQYLSTLLAEVDHLKRTRVDELNVWDKQMHDLLNSPSWRVTAPLRALKQLLRQQESGEAGTDTAGTNATIGQARKPG